MARGRQTPGRMLRSSPIVRVGVGVEGFIGRVSAGGDGVFLYVEAPRLLGMIGGSGEAVLSFGDSRMGPRR